MSRQATQVIRVHQRPGMTFNIAGLYRLVVDLGGADFTVTWRKSTTQGAAVIALFGGAMTPTQLANQDIASVPLPPESQFHTLPTLSTHPTAGQKGAGILHGEGKAMTHLLIEVDVTTALPGPAGLHINVSKKVFLP